MSGKYLWSNGCMYEGEWKKGKACGGKGRFSLPSGVTYEGEFTVGRMHCHSTFIGIDDDMSPIESAYWARNAMPTESGHTEPMELAAICGIIPMTVVLKDDAEMVKELNVVNMAGEGVRHSWRQSRQHFGFIISWRGSRGDYLGRIQVSYG
ncbi:hypothetical protein GYH30_018775 [Glycine max]|nr:hypothetical protein GYH30_018775 [Glycine max]